MHFSQEAKFNVLYIYYDILLKHDLISSFLEMPVTLILTR